MVKEGKSYSFDLAEPVYFITEETETHPLLSETVFVSEGTEELNGKTYDCVLRALKEDESQTLTYFFDGESLYAVRISMRMGESETNSLLTVTAFTEEIPDDMLFGIPENYTEYDPATEPDKPDFPSEAARIYCRNTYRRLWKKTGPIALPMPPPRRPTATHISSF